MHSHSRCEIKSKTGSGAAGKREFTIPVHHKSTYNENKLINEEKRNNNWNTEKWMKIELCKVGTELFSIKKWTILRRHSAVLRESR